MTDVLHRSVASRASPRSASYYDQAAAVAAASPRNAVPANLMAADRRSRMYADRLSAVPPTSASASHDDGDVSASESNFEESEASAFESDTDSAALSSDASVSADDEDYQSSSRHRRRRHPTSSESMPTPTPIDVRLRRVASAPGATPAERRHFEAEPSSPFSEMRSDFSSSPIILQRNKSSPLHNKRSLSLPLSGAAGVGLALAPPASPSPHAQCSISARRRHLMMPLDSIPEVSSEDERPDDDTASDPSIRGTVGTSQSCPSLHSTRHHLNLTPRSRGSSSRATPRGQQPSPAHFFSADIRRRSSTSTPRHSIGGSGFSLPTRLAARSSTTSTPRYFGGGGNTPRAAAVVSPRVAANGNQLQQQQAPGFRVPMIVNAVLAYISGLTWAQLRNAALLSPVAFVGCVCLAIAVACVLFVAVLVLAPFAWILVVLYVLVPSFVKKVFAYLHGIFVAPITNRVHAVYMRVMNAGTEMKRRFSGSAQGAAAAAANANNAPVASGSG